jgi:hypothetical protein
MKFKAAHIEEKELYILRLDNFFDKNILEINNRVRKSKKLGSDFHLLSCKLLQKYFFKELFINVGLEIGNPSKYHSYELVSEGKAIVCERKDYSWAVAGRIPSAKNAHLNEALLFLKELKPNIKKCIVMSEAAHPQRK